MQHLNEYLHIQGVPKKWFSQCCWGPNFLTKKSAAGQNFPKNMTWERLIGSLSVIVRNEWKNNFHRHAHPSTVEMRGVPGTDDWVGAPYLKHSEIHFLGQFSNRAPGWSPNWLPSSPSREIGRWMRNVNRPGLWRRSAIKMFPKVWSWLRPPD